jgi:hypothetical protein
VIRSARAEDIPRLSSTAFLFFQSTCGTASAAGSYRTSWSAPAAMGSRRIEVDANPGALAFYTRHGFRQTGVSQTRFGPAPRLALEL